MTILSGHARDWSKGFDVERPAILYEGAEDISHIFRATHWAQVTTKAADDPTIQLCRLKFGALRPLPLMPTMLDVFENEEPDAVYGFVDELPVMMLLAGALLVAQAGKKKSVRLRLNYGMNGQQLTTIAPKFSALPDATYATSATYKVIADGVTVVNTTTVTPTAAGGSVSVAINKLVKVLDIVLTVTDGGLVWSDWLANTNPMNAAKPVPPFSGIVFDAWGGNIIKFPSLAVVYDTLVGAVTVEPRF